VKRVIADEDVYFFQATSKIITVARTNDLSGLHGKYINIPGAHPLAQPFFFLRKL